MNKIIEEDFECLDGHITKALTFDKDNVYKISDFIELLQKAMEKYGDKEISTHDMNFDVISGIAWPYIYFDETAGVDNNGMICIFLNRRKGNEQNNQYMA